MFRTLQKFIKSPTAEVSCSVSLRYAHTEVKIPVPWGHIAGKWWNKNGRKPILAVHGWQDNANSFDRLVPLMSPKYSVLSIDLPGHGYSSRFPQGMNYHRMSTVIALKRILDHYDWKNVAVMGHSLGGQTCFLFTAIYPEQVDALVTLDILAPNPLNADKFIKTGGKAIDQFIKRDSQRVEDSPKYPYDKLVKMVTNSPIAPVSEEAAKILLERGSEKMEDGKYRLIRDPKIKGLAMTDAMQRSERELPKFCLGVQTNVLCIKAEGSSYYGKKEFFDKCWTNVAKSAKTADLRFVPGQHHVHLEDADIVAPILNSFLEKHY